MPCVSGGFGDSEAVGLAAVLADVLGDLAEVYLRYRGIVSCPSAV